MANPKLPPHDREAEASVLGCVLVDKDALIEVVEFLKAWHFYEEKNGHIYEAMLSLYEKGEPIDLITLTDELKRNGTLVKVGGKDYISDLISVVATSANIEKYGRIVEEAAMKRKLIASASKVVEMAFSESEDVRKLLDKTEAEIFSISQEYLKRDFTAVRDALAESFDRLDEIHKSGGGLRGVPTGFTDLDNKLAGMQASNMIVLAARPGQGKTAFSLNLAQHVTVNLKIPVGIFSLEMSKEELVDRLLVAQADIDAWRLKTGKLGDEDFSKLSDAMGALAEAPLFIDDTPGLNILEMRTKARRLQLEHKAQFFIVDYLQLMDSGRRYNNRVEEVSSISQSIKNLARELKVPILAISQLSRAVEHRGEKRPQLADLRESGAIEQDADVVMFLYRADDDEGWDKQQAMKLLIAKHRNGPLGEIDLLFRGDRIRFYPTEKHQTEG